MPRAHFPSQACRHRRRARQPVHYGTAIFLLLPSELCTFARRRDPRCGCLATWRHGRLISFFTFSPSFRSPAIRDSPFLAPVLIVSSFSAPRSFVFLVFSYAPLIGTNYPSATQAIALVDLTSVACFRRVQGGIGRKSATVCFIRTSLLHPIAEVH
jgi:hypothetical protein